MKKRGLRFIKADLHIHTPASACFNGDVTPEDIIQKALSEGLHAIAITDHNSGAWIDQVKDAANGKISVFPGVEITSQSGKTGAVHLIALFDVDKGSEDINSLLGKLDITPDKFGHPLQISGHFNPVNACRIIVQRTDPDLLESRPCQI
jgi:PHP family Zn ribbon phosphoesterase